MKTLDLTPYSVETADSKDVPYQVRDTLMNALFAQPDMKARALLARDDLARRIRDAAGDAIELSAPEVLQLVDAFESVQGFGRNDVELVRRVLALAPERT